MPPQELDNKFPQLLQALPSNWESLAHEHKAFVLPRRFKTVAQLLRAVFLYSACDCSLRAVAGWFTGRDQRRTDEAVRLRLRGCRAWLAALLGQMLPAVSWPESAAAQPWRLLIRDASVINGPGAQGTDYRLHLSYDPCAQKLEECQLYDAHQSEGLQLFRHAARTLVLGDRGLAKAKGLLAVRQAGAHFCVRMSPNYLALRTPAGAPFEVLGALQQAGAVQELTFAVVVRETKSGATCPAFLHARRLSQQAANQARRRAKRRAQANGHALKQSTLCLCDWLLILTSVSPEVLPAEVSFELYRVRWQIELVFKRLKSLLALDALRAKAGSPLAEVYLWGKLLFALLLEGWAAQRVAPAELRLDGERRLTSWRLWKLLVAELKEAVLETAAWAGLDWRAVLSVLGERRRKRKLQGLPTAVAQWLQCQPATALS